MGHLPSKHSPEPSFFVAALCSCLVLCASCFVLCAQNHIFWSKLAALCSCFVLCAWLCATKRPDFCKQERLPAAARHLLRAHASCLASGDQKTRKAESMSTEHKAQSMSTKHEHKAQSNDKKTGLCAKLDEAAALLEQFILSPLDGDILVRDS
jgi:hypothetical protein